jgi:hypothetical protein
MVLGHWMPCHPMPESGSTVLDRSGSHLMTDCVPPPHCGDIYEQTTVEIALSPLLRSARLTMQQDYNILTYQQHHHQIHSY